MISCSLCYINEIKFANFPSNIFRTNCDHTICWFCFNIYINSTKQYPIPCFACNASLTDIEFEKYLEPQVHSNFSATRSHFVCVNDLSKYPCFNLGCTGIFVNSNKEPIEWFNCPKCKKKTCLKCYAVHKQKETCLEWEMDNQDLVNCRKMVAERNKKLIENDLAMKCVECSATIEKLFGCDGLLCSVCHTGLCFRTKKRRWGPNGEGDTSDGCRCMWDLKTLCHKDCVGCFVHQPFNPIKAAISINKNLRDRLWAHINETI